MGTYTTEQLIRAKLIMADSSLDDDGTLKTWAKKVLAEDEAKKSEDHIFRGYN